MLDERKQVVGNFIYLCTLKNSVQKHTKDALTDEKACGGTHLYQANLAVIIKLGEYNLSQQQSGVVDTPVYYFSFIGFTSILHSFDPQIVLYYHYAAVSFIFCPGFLLPCIYLVKNIDLHVLPEK